MAAQQVKAMASRRTGKRGCAQTLASVIVCVYDFRLLRCNIYSKGMSVIAKVSITLR